MKETKFNLFDWFILVCSAIIFLMGVLTLFSTANDTAARIGAFILWSGVGFLAFRAKYKKLQLSKNSK